MTKSTLVPMTIKDLKMGFISSLVLQDAEHERFLALRLAEGSAKKMKLEMTGGGRSASGVPDLLANTLKYMNGVLGRVELRWEDRPGMLATMVVDQEGKEVRLPARLIDALLMAWRHGVDILVDELALARQGIRAGETGSQAANAEWLEAFRLTAGFSGLDRLDDAILACRRLRELAPASESWCVTLGELYARKGQKAAAARELARGLAWYAREGYLTGAAQIGQQMAELDLDSLPPVGVRAPAVIEDFNTATFNNEWWGGGDVISAPVRESGTAYRISPDRTWFILAMPGTQWWEVASALEVNVHRGAGSGHLDLSAAVGLTIVGSKSGFYRSTYMSLKPGWNRLAIALSDPVWTRGGPSEETNMRLDGRPLGPVTNLQVLFDHPAGELALGEIRLT